MFSGSFLYVESELLFKIVPCGYCILVIFSNYYTVKRGNLAYFSSFLLFSSAEHSTFDSAEPSGGRRPPRGEAHGKRPPPKHHQLAAIASFFDFFSFFTYWTHMPHFLIFFSSSYTRPNCLIFRFFFLFFIY